MAKVAVRHPKDPKRPWVIPAELYDPEKHELWTEPAPRAVPDPQPLPARAPEGLEAPWWPEERPEE